jgi:hypothetical protein
MNKNKFNKLRMNHTEGFVVFEITCERSGSVEHRLPFYGMEELYVILNAVFKRQHRLVMADVYSSYDVDEIILRGIEIVGSDATGNSIKACVMDEEGAYAYAELDESKVDQANVERLNRLREHLREGLRI